MTLFFNLQKAQTEMNSVGSRKQPCCFWCTTGLLSLRHASTKKNLEQIFGAKCHWHSFRSPKKSFEPRLPKPIGRTRRWYVDPLMDVLLEHLRWWTKFALAPIASSSILSNWSRAKRMQPIISPEDITPLARRSWTWSWTGFANWLITALASWKYYQGRLYLFSWRYTRYLFDVLYASIPIPRGNPRKDSWLV